MQYQFFCVFNRVVNSWYLFIVRMSSTFIDAMLRQRSPCFILICAFWSLSHLIICFWISYGLFLFVFFSLLFIWTSFKISCFFICCLRRRSCFQFLLWFWFCGFSRSCSFFLFPICLPPMLGPLDWRLCSFFVSFEVEASSLFKARDSYGKISYCDILLVANSSGRYCSAEMPILTCIRVTQPDGMGPTTWRLDQCPLVYFTYLFIFVTPFPLPNSFTSVAF